MTKAEIVAIMAKSAGGSKTSAERAMNAFVGGIVESLRFRHVRGHAPRRPQRPQPAHRQGDPDSDGQGAALPPEPHPQVRDSLSSLW